MIGKNNNISTNLVTKFNVSHPQDGVIESASKRSEGQLWHPGSLAPSPECAESIIVTVRVTYVVFALPMRASGGRARARARASGSPNMQTIFLEIFR